MRVASRRALRSAVRGRWRRMGQFRTSLEARVSLSIAGLLIAVMVLTVAVAEYGLQLYASGVAERDLAAGGQVFERSLAARQDQMRSAAEVVARDFGFRAAFASNDRATLASALSSLAQRAHAQGALVVGLDGSVTASPTMPPIDRRALLAGLNSGANGGVLVGNGFSLAVAARIELPDLAGWLVLARPLQRADLDQFSRLSAIPIAAQVVDGAHDAAGGAPGRITRHNGADGIELVALSPLPSLQSGIRPMLVLRYPLANATRATQSLRVALISIALLAVATGVFLGTRLARSVLQPMHRLAAATGSMARGEMVRVAVNGDDEIAALGRSFNTMVDAIEEREARITHAWLHDTLTGLPNRRFFQEKLDRALERGGADRAIMVVFLDLDDFKLVNDTMGHDVGDALLRHCAALLPTIAPRAQIARLGSDEFGLLFDNLVSPDAIGALVDNLARAMAIDVEIAGAVVPLSISCGIAICPDDARDGATLLKHAELALSRAKRDGKRTCRFFEATLDEAASRRRRLEIDLRAALRNGEFQLHFQPLYDPALGRIKGFEALLRWDHPQSGRINPADFIPIAEQSGLIIPISEWVIREACVTAKRWPDDISVAVNISPRHFEVPGLTQCVLSALSYSGLAPHRLELEITESVFIQEFSATTAILRQLRDLGVRIALDDFGTGYSSLSYLRSFPFDKVKIDQSFVRDLEGDASARAIVRAITALAQALGMETLAEGVEDAAQYDALIAEGCGVIQGYLISRPVPTGDVAGLLADWNGRDREAAGRLG